MHTTPAQAAGETTSISTLIKIRKHIGGRELSSQRIMREKHAAKLRSHCQRNVRSSSDSKVKSPYEWWTLKEC